MNKKALFFFRNEKDIPITIFAFLTCTLFNFISDLFRNTLLFHFFYQGIFGLGICIFFPLWFVTKKQKQCLSAVGITTNNWVKSVLIGFLIATTSIAGRIMVERMHIILPNFNKLVYLTVCLTMSSFFEEIFFRGFLQTRFEKLLGMVPAILISALCFSIYHIGYITIRENFSELIPLFIAGILFSISFRITNNIITSFIVNLPHTIITFLADQNYIAYGVHFNKRAALLSLLATFLGLFLIWYFDQKNKKVQMLVQ